MLKMMHEKHSMATEFMFLANSIILVVFFSCYCKTSRGDIVNKGIRHAVIRYQYYEEEEDCNMSTSISISEVRSVEMFISLLISLHARTLYVL